MFPIFRGPARAVAFALAVATPPAISPALAASTGGSDTGGANTASAAQPGYAEAKAAADAGDYRGALKMLAVVVKAEPRNADAWNLMGYSSRKLKQYDNAARYYDAALKVDPQHLGALEYQGELFVQIGAFDKARANLDRLRSLCGTCEEATDLQTALSAAGQS
ncbi:MAG: tetratricopeptide repeat protein [Paracoccaceae bacterium]